MAVICSITCISAGLGENGDINLANYGVFMKKIGQARLVTNYWTNSFLLPLPAVEVTQIRAPVILCLNSSSRTGRSLDPLRSATVNRNRNEPCGEHADFSEFIFQLYSRNHENKVKIVTLFPNYGDGLVNSRHRKALLGFVSRITS